MGDLTNIEATTIVSKIIEETTTYAIIVEVVEGNTIPIKGRKAYAG